VCYWVSCGRSTEAEELIRNLFVSDLSALMKCHKDKRGVMCVCACTQGLFVSVSRIEA